MRLIVCAAELAEAAACAQGPSHMLALVSPGQAAPTPPPGVAHLRLEMNDVAARRPGLTAPSRQQVAELLAFADAWSGERPLLIHCFAGVSRSPAAALAIASQRRPDLPELALAQALRLASPEATPNAMILDWADALLGRDRRLAAAGRAIGRGREWMQPCAFDWRVQPSSRACSDVGVQSP
jgi:predicted protein tyrosine phosphatase